MDKIAMAQQTVEAYRQQTADMEKEAGIVQAVPKFLANHGRAIERTALVGGTLAAVPVAKSGYNDWRIGRKVRQTIEQQRAAQRAARQAQMQQQQAVQ